MSEKAAEISGKMKARAKEYDAKLCKAKESSRTSTLEVGWWGAKIKAEGLFPVLGFDSETAYYESRRVGRSTWYSMVRLAESFKNLPEKEFLKFNAECAKMLAKLPEEKRYNKDLIKKAQEMMAPQFERVIVKYKAAQDKIEEGDVSVTLKFRMPLSMRDFIVATLDEFIEQHGLDKGDYTKALHLMAAEIRTGQHVRTKVMQHLPKLKQFYDLTGDAKVDLSADEILHKTHAGLGEYIRETAAAAGIQ